MKNTKKGIMQSTIAIIIIVLLSTAILIVFLANFTELFSSNVDKGTCRASVELRGAKALLGSTGEGAKITIPLRCKTEYYCLTMGGTCPEKYTKISVNTMKDIQREVAYRMYDCWWMLGEGQLDFFSTQYWKEFGLNRVQSSCVVCSQIAFDDKVQAKYPTIDMGSYLNTEIVPRKNMTYLKYFSGNKDTLLPSTVKAQEIPTNQKYTVMFMGIQGDALWEPIARDVGAVTGALGFSIATVGPWATMKGVGTAAGALTKTATIGATELTTAGGALYSTGGTAATVLSPAAWIVGAIATVLGTVQVAETWVNQIVVAGYCDGSKKGCFNVIGTPSTASNIGAVCSNIESIP